MIKITIFILSAIVFFIKGAWIMIALTAIISIICAVSTEIVHRTGAARGDEFYKNPIIPEEQKKKAWIFHSIGVFSTLMMIGCWGYALFLLIAR